MAGITQKSRAAAFLIVIPLKQNGWIKRSEKNMKKLW